MIDDLFLLASGNPWDRWGLCRSTEISALIEEAAPERMGAALYSKSALSTSDPEVRAGFYMGFLMRDFWGRIFGEVVAQCLRTRVREGAAAPPSHLSSSLLSSPSSFCGRR